MSDFNPNKMSFPALSTQSNMRLSSFDLEIPTPQTRESDYQTLRDTFACDGVAALGTRVYILVFTLD